MLLIFRRARRWRCQCCDSRIEVVFNRQGSYAGFSDFFRYKVLNRFGGLYADKT